MCLTFVLPKVSKEYPLILLFNRDEDYDRKTTPAHWWPDKNFLAGKDELKGGTWAAVSKTGRFALLTFIRAARMPITPDRGRGELVPIWMDPETNYQDFERFLRDSRNDFLGYNLLFGDQENAYHFENKSGMLTLLDPRIHGVSNALLNTPWYKVIRGRSDIKTIIPQLDETNPKEIKPIIDSLFFILRNDQLAPDDQVQVTGLSPAREKLKSALFIGLPDYGTICSTIVLFHRCGEIQYFERSFGRMGAQTNELEFKFDLLSTYT